MTIRGRSLAVIAGGYLAGGLSYTALPEPLWRGDGALPVWFWRPLIAFLLPTAAAVTLTLLGRLSMRDSSLEGDARSAVIHDAIVFRIVLFVVSLHAMVLAGLLGLQGFAARIGPVLLGLVLVGVGNLLPRTRPNLVIGIRTSRTLVDPRVWMQVHRHAGYVAVGLGIVLAGSSLVLPWPSAQRVFAMALLIAAATLLAAYRQCSTVERTPR
jgi:uncharacterized membrane protein